MTLTISKCKLSKQQHTITLNYTLGENEKSSLIFTLMICRNFFAHRNAVCKTRDGLVHLIKYGSRAAFKSVWFGSLGLERQTTLSSAGSAALCDSGASADSYGALLMRRT